MYLVFDIGGQSLKYAVYDKNLKIYCENAITYPGLIDINQLLIYLDDVIRKICNEYEINKIGISSPGVVNNKTGFITGLSAIKNYIDINLYQLLAKYQLPIQVENDAKCAVLAELCLGSGKKLNNFILLTVGTGIGGGIVLNRKLLSGSHYMAGQIGCIIEEINGSASNTNFSEVASSYALEHYYSKLTDNKFLSGKELYNQYQTDELAKKAVDKMILILAKNICNLGFIIDPEVVFIGGAISSNLFFIELLEQKVNELFKKSNMPQLLKIEPSQFKNNAGKLGALSLLLFNSEGQLYE